MQLFLVVLGFLLDLSLKVHEKLENISDDLEFSIDNDLFDLIDHLRTEFLQLSLDDAPIEMNPGLRTRISHVGKYWIKDREMMHVRRLDGFRS